MKLPRFARPWLALPLLAAGLAGCPNAGSVPSVYPARPGEGIPSKGDAIGNLIQQANAAAQAELQENLANPLRLDFPVRLGVLFYNYAPSMAVEDQQALLNQFKQDFAASGLVKSTTIIPPNLTSGQSSLEEIRKMVSRFGVDTLLVVSGNNTFLQSAQQAPSFFDTFSNKADYEAKTSLTALPMGVLSGKFMLPLQSAGKASAVLDRDDAGFAQAAADLKKRAETDALKLLKEQFLKALQTQKDTQPAATPTPAVTPTPRPTPTSSPSPAL